MYVPHLRGAGTLWRSYALQMGERVRTLVPFPQKLFELSTFNFLQLLISFHNVVQTINSIKKIKMQKICSIIFFLIILIITRKLKCMNKLIIGQGTLVQNLILISLFLFTVHVAYLNNQNLNFWEIKFKYH